MRLDSTLRTIIEAMGDTPSMDFDSLSIEEALRLARRSRPAQPAPPDVRDMTIASFDGEPIRLRLYAPQARGADLPMLLHLHGGGFVSGSIEADDDRCRVLADTAGCLVVSAAYRLAPEHPFPTAIEDAVSAWRWMAQAAESLGADPTRRAVSGSSAGGHIALGMSALARRRSLPAPCLQLLTYPVIDPAMDTPSYNLFSDGPVITRARMAWYWRQYASGDGSVHAGELWSPMTADGADAPRTHIATAEYDVLRDEGEAYAARLGAAGVEVGCKRYAGMTHGFLALAPQHPTSLELLCDSARALRSAFGA